MTQYKILVVDDNADIRELLEILLTSEGYAVTLASSGEQALQLLSPELDLVILDIMMPGISGIRVCEAIRKQSNVPVLFLTAKGQDEDISLGLRVGADDYLPKPFSHAQLTARVKSLLRRYRVYQGKSEPEEDEWLVRGPLRINRTYNEERPAHRPAGAGIPDAAAHGLPRGAHLLGPEPVRERVERAVSLLLQRHGDGAHPQAAGQAGG